MANSARLRAVVGLVIAIVPVAAYANYRCVGQDGRKYYGQAIPPQCVGMPVEQLNEAGRVVRRIEPSAPQPAPAPPDKAKLREEASAAKRDRALLATYASEAEIEEARRRALRATGSADSAAINARYDADLKRYRELVRLRENPPVRVEKAVRVIKPQPALEPSTGRQRQWGDPDDERLRQGRDVAEREARMLRELEQQREEPARGVLRIDDPPAPAPLSPGRDSEWRNDFERGDSDSPTSRPYSTPMRR